MCVIFKILCPKFQILNISEKTKKSCLYKVDSGVTETKPNVLKAKFLAWSLDSFMSEMR